MRYAILSVDGDRIAAVVDWDGVSPHVYGSNVLHKLPDDALAEWVGESFADAQKGALSKGAKKVAKVEPPPLPNPRPSGYELNVPQAEIGVTSSGEHPLDPVLGSEMKTPTPQMTVAIVPSTQPKTDAQARKDAGDQRIHPADRAKAQVAKYETASDRAKAKADEQEKKIVAAKAKLAPAHKKPAAAKAADSWGSSFMNPGPAKKK